jgi:DDE superfamily endonuclease
MLTAAEARRVQREIRDKMPDQMRLRVALWTAQAVRELSKSHYTTPRDPRRTTAWLRSDYPSIAARAKREKRVIYWSDATAVRDRDLTGRGYAPECRTPVLTQTWQEFSVSLIAAVSNRGLMRFKPYKGTRNGAIFIDFMTRLVRDAKNVPLASFDKSSGAVQEWLAHHKDEIEIFYLPAYAAEHTPDEYLNNDLKQTIKNKPRLFQEFSHISLLRWRQQLPVN